ncbi:MAG: hypothetical protein Q4A66_06515, partial [Eubacteriales bacterium]|nr:hypothetical protein [Eubacteriales bacterium]
MRVFLRKVFRVVYFYLMTAGLPVLLMHLALENERLSAALYAGALLLALPLSLLPGKVLRGRLPLRFPRAALLGVLIIAGTTAFAVQNSFFFLRGTLAGAIMALMMLFSMREATLEFPLWTGQHGASIGLVLYLFGAGVTGSLVPAPFLNGLFWGESLLFLLCTAFYLNADNML